ncbi:hypothetical protein SteCoe_5778 [Stentor coeruleus]|uniref:START domain-containing protein n=1 Tax=Stentor coeruleus TaxID=5963 RepID=A0A1R2CRM2_9CILI|nr:hypothetical protein SteCoe_5778 [Stentor coeruleus]
MEARIQEIKDLFYDDKLQDAYKKLRTLEGELSSDPSSLDLLNSTEEINILRDDLKEADRCLELLADLDSWNPIKETENIAIFSKTSNVDFIIRAEMLLDQPIFPVLSICNEIDLLPSWIQVVKSVETVKTITPFRRLLWYKFNIPWPASNRDMVVNAFGLTIPENNSIMIILRDVSESKFLGTDIPQPDSGDVRVTMKTGILSFMKRSETQTQVSFLSHSDPHVPLVPESLLNWCSKTGIYYFIKSMEDKAMGFKGSIFEERVAANQAFYNKLMSVLNEALGE